MFRLNFYSFDCSIQNNQGGYMFSNKIISERFTDLRKSKKDKYGKNIPVFQLAQELSDKKYIENYTTDVIRQEIGKVENKGKFPQLFLIEGYSKYFKVTSDYLLGIRESRTVDENIAMISKTTGLSDDSINILKELSPKDKLVLNALIKNNGITNFRYALENYYNQTFKAINIRGLGESMDMTDSESRKVFEYISVELLKDILNTVIHDKDITNEFMRDANIKYLDAFEKAIEQNNELFDHTDNRKEFNDKMKDYIKKNKNDVLETDYYKTFADSDKERK